MSGTSNNKKIIISINNKREGETSPLLVPVEDNNNIKNNKNNNNTNNKNDSPPQSTPLPWMKLILMSLVQFCEAFNANSIFAYLGYMIVDFGLVKDVAHAGFYSGFVASSFFFFQFLSSFLWGRYSDVVGRRVILLIGLGGSIVSCVVFGLSKNLAVAIIARAVGGVINGNLPVAKTYLGEVTDKSNQAQSYTIFGISWGLGIVLGPVIGGILAMPTTKYTWWPNWLLGSALHHYPFLLPNLVTAFFYLLTFIMCFFFMTETVKKENQSSSSTNVLKSVYVSFLTILHNRTAILSCIFFAVHCFMVIIYVEVFPLWAITPHNQHGLSFGTSDIGVILSVGGVYGVFMQVLTFKRMALVITYKQILKYSILIMAAIMILIVEVARFYSIRPLFWIALGVCVCINQQLMLGTFSAFNLVMNNSVPFANMGSMNGVAMSLAALGRTVGPTLGSNLYAWSVSVSYGYVISYRTVFYMVGILYVINILLASRFLPESVNLPYIISHPPDTSSNNTTTSSTTTSHNGKKV